MGDSLHNFILLPLFTLFSNLFWLFFPFAYIFSGNQLLIHTDRFKLKFIAPISPSNEGDPDPMDSPTIAAVFIPKTWYHHDYAIFGLDDLYSRMASFLSLNINLFILTQSLNSLAGEPLDQDYHPSFLLLPVLKVKRNLIWLVMQVSLIALNPFPHFSSILFYYNNFRSTW